MSAHLFCHIEAQLNIRKFFHSVGIRIDAQRNAAVLRLLRPAPVDIKPVATRYSFNRPLAVIRKGLVTNLTSLTGRLRAGDIAARVLFKLHPTAIGAKIIGLALMLGLRHGIFAINLHMTDRIGDARYRSSSN
jgi:hypothetical protein